ncbi:hypothetical protein ACFO5Q_07880 [Kordiimonas lipolytica]|uniref:Uncharacterized protein n=1 Tax=Kordiimonas lipolytica TaxID=1662421 RepID=A0ABV8UA37_9PROT|nr:hypothetical protein [Kordiimonas lipolytica]
MTATLVKKHVAITALFALMFLRFVDLAVFDAGQGEPLSPHAKAHASGIAHSHTPAEVAEHDTMHGSYAHVGIHTLLNVFVDADAPEVLALQQFTPRFGFSAKEQARAQAYRPPIPPPLA